MFIPVTDL